MIIGDIFRLVVPGESKSILLGKRQETLLFWVIKAKRVLII